MISYSLYKITNLVNGKPYIGMTSKCIEERFKGHCHKSSRCTKLKHAIDKYGAENFKIETLCIGDYSYIQELEEKAIILYNSIEDGYNILPKSQRLGGLKLPESVKSKISESLNKFYSENISVHLGRVYGIRKPDNPCYICGFWFKNPQQARENLRLPYNTYLAWKKEGTLGEVQHLRKDGIEQIPLYVGGFWFPTMTHAADCLGVSKKAIWKRINTGFIEAHFNKKIVTGEDNHMYGRTGDKHHASKAVYVQGVYYGSVLEASRLSGFTRKVIDNRLKNNHPDFQYVNPE